MHINTSNHDYVVDDNGTADRNNKSRSFVSLQRVRQQQQRNFVAVQT